MQTYLLIHADTSKREEKAEEILLENNLARNHPNLLWFSPEEKLGIEQARQIKDFLSLKPYQGSSQAVILICAENLTPDAQNALLKVLEEPPEGTIFILGASSEDQLLPTVLSRCQIVNLSMPATSDKGKYQQEIEKLFGYSMEKRFQFIEKLDKKEEFLLALASYFRQQMLKNLSNRELQVFLSDLIDAERWANQNVNIRAILEYLMLRIPSLKE